MNISERLAELGHILPEAPKPIAAYVPAVISGGHLFVSGQLPITAGKLLHTGAVPTAVTLDQARACAIQCVLNGLAIVNDTLDGDWSRFERVVRIGAFVQSENGYAQQPAVANGASELLVELFGDQGRHARAAVGVNALPLDAPVEIEFLFAIRT